MSGNDDPTVIGILMGMKEDLGEIRSTSTAMKESLDTHIADDKRLTDRVTALEMRVEREKGFAKAWQMLAAAAGALLGYLIQIVVSWMRSKP